jgi:hypothetical protein
VLLSRRGNSADLLHHAQSIVVGPTFRYLAAGDAVDDDPRSLYSVASGRDANEFPWWVPRPVRRVATFSPSAI